MSNKPSQSTFDDVRMRGFRSRTSVDETLAWIDEFSKTLNAEQVAIDAACNRILAQEIVSDSDVPSFRRAMMDGFALHASETTDATPDNPSTLTVIGEVLPGRFFAGEVRRGEAVRIMTGAPMPRGADAVSPAEKVNQQGEQISVWAEVAPEKHVGKVGEDIQRGLTVLPARRRLRAQDLGVLSSLCLSHVGVVRRPRVKLIVTGDELCEVGKAPQAHQTMDANGPMLRALIQRDGGELLFDGILEDHPEVIRNAMQDPSADIVVVSGGSSVGQEDHAPRILSELGELSIHGVAMRPSSPAGMGKVDDRLVFLLPGNPVSCLCAYDFFAARSIRLRGGRSPCWPYPELVGALCRQIKSVAGRQDYVRVTIDEAGQVDPIAIAGASVLSSTTRADGFVVVPADSEGFSIGAEVKVFLYDQVGG